MRGYPMRPRGVRRADGADLTPLAVVARRQHRQEVLQPLSGVAACCTLHVACCVLHVACCMFQCAGCMVHLAASCILPARFADAVAQKSCELNPRRREVLLASLAAHSEHRPASPTVRRAVFCFRTRWSATNPSTLAARTSYAASPAPGAAPAMPRAREGARAARSPTAPDPIPEAIMGPMLWLRDKSTYTLPEYLDSTVPSQSTQEP